MSTMSQLLGAHRVRVMADLAPWTKPAITQPHRHPNTNQQEKHLLWCRGTDWCCWTRMGATIEWEKAIFVPVAPSAPGQKLQYLLQKVTPQAATSQNTHLNTAPQGYNLGFSQKGQEQTKLDNTYTLKNGLSMVASRALWAGSTKNYSCSHFISSTPTYWRFEREKNCLSSSEFKTETQKLWQKLRTLWHHIFSPAKFTPGGCAIRLQ